MKLILESEDEIISFLRAANLKDGSHFNALAALEFACKELETYSYIRNDLLIRLNGYIERLQMNQERMVLAERSDREKKKRSKKELQQ